MSRPLTAQTVKTRPGWGDIYQLAGVYLLRDTAHSYYVKLLPIIQLTYNHSKSLLVPSQAT